MAINQDVVVTLKAVNNATAAFNSFNANLNNTMNTVKRLGEALVAGFALRDTINTMEEWTRQVREVQTATGLAAAEASRLTFTGRALGISADELNTSLGRLAKQMFETHQNANAATDVFKKWGIQLKNTDGSIRNVNTVLAEAADRVRQLGDGAASRALELDLFGRAGGRIHELLLRGADGVKELERQSDALGLTLNDNALSAMREFNIQANIFGLAVDGLKITLGRLFLPVLTAVIDALTRFVQWVRTNIIETQRFAGIVKAIGEAFRVVSGFIKAVIGPLAALIGHVLNNKEAMGILKDAIIALTVVAFAAWVLGAVSAFERLIVLNLPLLALVAAVTGVVEVIQHFGDLPRIVNDLTTALHDLSTGDIPGALVALQDAAVATGDAFQNAWSALVSWLQTVGIPALMNFLTDTLPRFGQWIMDSLPIWLTNMGTLIVGVIQWLTSTGWPDLVSFIEENVPRLAQWILDSIPVWAKNLGDLLGAVIDWFIGDFIPAFAELLAKVIPKLIEWSANIATFIRTKLGPELIEAAIGLAGAIAGGIESGLEKLGGKIFSPLKLLLQEAFREAANAALGYLGDIYNSIIQFAQKIPFIGGLLGGMPQLPGSGGVGVGGDGGGGGSAVAPAQTGTAAAVVSAGGAYIGGVFYPIAPTAEGGIAMTPQLRSVAERGPEAIIPLDRWSGMGGGNTVNVYVSGNIATSENELAERIAAKVGDVLVRQVIINRQLAY